MAIGRRLRIATRWLRGQRNGVSATELARFLTGPTCAVSSREFVVGMEQGDNDTIAVRVRGVDRPLLWPADQPRYSLFMVLSEALDPDNWHFYETPETRVTENDVVADCGAAEGLFALLVQPRARHVFAIEPAPHWTTTLRRTFADAPNVTVLPVGLGAAPGRAYLTGGTLDSAISATPGGEGHEITVETIDRLFADRDQELTYLKADLEGFELSMLAGAELTIARYHPKIAITTYHEASHAKQITEFLLGIEPRYQIRTKGIDAETGSPVMLHAWMPTPTT